MAPFSILKDSGLLTFQPVKSLPLNRLVQPGSVAGTWSATANSRQQRSEVLIETPPDLLASC
jgi:hypothetical protein